MSTLFNISTWLHGFVKCVDESTRTLFAQCAKFHNIRYKNRNITWTARKQACYTDQLRQFCMSDKTDGVQLCETILQKMMDYTQSQNCCDIWEMIMGAGQTLQFAIREWSKQVHKQYNKKLNNIKNWKEKKTKKIHNSRLFVNGDEEKQDINKLSNDAKRKIATLKRSYFTDALLGQFCEFNMKNKLTQQFWSQFQDKRAFHLIRLMAICMNYGYQLSEKENYATDWLCPSPQSKTGAFEWFAKVHQTIAGSYMPQLPNAKFQSTNKKKKKMKHIHQLKKNDVKFPLN